MKNTVTGKQKRKEKIHTSVGSKCVQDILPIACRVQLIPFIDTVNNVVTLVVLAYALPGFATANIFCDERHACTGMAAQRQPNAI